MEWKVALNLGALIVAAVFMSAHARSFAALGGPEGEWLRAFALGSSVVCGTVAFGAVAAMLAPGLRRRLTERVMAWAMVGLIAAFVVMPMAAKIAGRMRHGTTRMVLDSTLQIEVAADFLIRGKNPYTETYHKTALEEWHRGVERPPIFHLVYPPLPVVLAAPLRAAFGDRFDFRFLLMAALGVGLVVAWYDWRDTGLRPLLLFLTFANPWILGSVIVGRLDVLITLFLILAMREFRRGGERAAGVWVSLAIATKTPLALLVVPLAAAAKGGVARSLTWSLGPAAMIALPFLAWDAGAFVEDVVLSLAGRTASPFPIIDVGVYGISGIPLIMGWVNSPEAFFPFALIQVPATVVLLWLGAKAARGTPRADVVMATYALASAAFFYLGRFSDPVYYGALVASAAIGVGYAGQSAARPVESAA